MILLDTNALIWLHQRHPRMARLTRQAARLYISPASVLELQFLVEAGRLRLRSGASVAELVQNTPGLVDSPESADWFEQAMTLAWTRDPFDRLLVAHARVRGWRLATGDRALVEQLGDHECLQL